MRLVIRVYRDGKTKPYIDEFKRDCFDELEVYQHMEDIEDFLVRNYNEIADENDSDEIG